MSSAKSMFLMMISCTLVFALNFVMLKNLPSDLVCMYAPSVEFPKACLRGREKWMPKRVGSVSSSSMIGRGSMASSAVLSTRFALK